MDPKQDQIMEKCFVILLASHQKTCCWKQDAQWRHCMWRQTKRRSLFCESSTVILAAIIHCQKLTEFETDSTDALRKNWQLKQVGSTFHQRKHFLTRNVWGNLTPLFHSDRRERLSWIRNFWIKFKARTHISVAGMNTSFLHGSPKMFQESCFVIIIWGVVTWNTEWVLQVLCVLWPCATVDPL